MRGVRRNRDDDATVNNIFEAFSAGRSRLYKGVRLVLESKGELQLLRDFSSSWFGSARDFDVSLSDLRSVIRKHGLSKDLKFQHLVESHLAFYYII